MTRYWFRPRRFGYGAQPVTWEGWAVTLGSLVVFLGGFQLALWRGEWLIALLAVAFLAAVLLLAKAKTDGEWRWRSGGRNSSDGGEAGQK